MSSTVSTTGTIPKVKSKTTGIIGFFIGFFVVCIILNIITGGNFLSFVNIKTIITHAVIPAILALGMNFIFASGIIDLSIGAKLLLSANVGAILVKDFGLGYTGLLIGAITCCIIFQLISAWLVISLDIPSWIAGLGLALIIEAIFAEYSTARIRANAASIINMPDNARAFGTMPLMLIIMLICFLFAFILFNYTKTGINIQAIGSNKNVAEAMGVNSKKTIIIASIIGAIFIGIAAVVQISYSSRMDAITGLGSLSRLFNALACVLLAQSISRIFNNIVGILVSAVVLMAIFNALTMLGVPPGTWQAVALGAIIVICGILANIGYKGVVK